MKNWQRMAHFGVMTTLIIVMTPSLAQGAESSTQPHNDTSEPYISLYPGPNYQGDGESIILTQTGCYSFFRPAQSAKNPSSNTVTLWENSNCTGNSYSLRQWTNVPNLYGRYSAIGCCPSG